MSLLVLAAIALAILVGITALVVGLASASWQVLLFLLLLVWLITQRLLKQIEAPAGLNSGGTAAEGSTVDRLTVESSADSDTLTYRGAKYHTPTAAEMAAMPPEAHELSGKYRGCTWKTTESEPAVSTQPPAAEMKYRGAKVTPPAH